MKIKHALSRFCFFLITAAVPAVFSCGGGGSSYTVGGVAFGIDAGESVVLQNNLSDDLNLNEDGEFVFAESIGNGASYDVTVLTHPAGKTCSIGNNEGTIAGANVTNVQVACGTDSFTVGGTTAGLEAGETLVLQNNLDDDLALTQDGAFTFAVPIAGGGLYDVTVLTAPEGKTCSVSRGEGVIKGFDISDVGVVCSANAYTVGGQVTGYTSGDELALLLNGDDEHPLSILAEGVFNFPDPMADGSEYDVTVGTTPDNKFYLLSNKGGTVSGANVTDVGVRLCPLSELTELKRLTRISTPAIADLNYPMYVQAVGDYMLAVSIGDASNGKTYLIDPLTYEVLSSANNGYQSAWAALVNDEVWVINNDGTLTVLRINGTSLEVIEQSLVITTEENEKHLDAIVADFEGNVWVANEKTQLWKIDTATRTVVLGPWEIAVGSIFEVGSMAVDSYGNLWIGHHRWISDSELLGTLTKIDTETHEIKAEVPAGSLPFGIVSDTMGNVWVVNIFDGTLSKIDAMKNEVLGTVTITDNPDAENAQQVVVDPSNKYVWVTLYDGYDVGKVVIFDADTMELKTSVNVGYDPFGIAIDTYGKIWTGNIRYNPGDDPEGGSISIVGCP